MIRSHNRVDKDGQQRARSTRLPKKVEKMLLAPKSTFSSRIWPVAKTDLLPQNRSKIDENRVSGSWGPKKAIFLCANFFDFLIFDRFSAIFSQKVIFFDFFGHYVCIGTETMPYTVPRRLKI